jgi:hypothetical protein
VYRLVDMDKPQDLVRAAVAVLPHAVASHETAAEIHGIPRVARDKAVVTVHSRTTHSFLGVTVRRTNDLDESHVCVVDGLPVTTLPRTVCDLAAILHPRHLSAIVDDLVASGRLDPIELRALAESLVRKGKPGSTALRSLIDERAATDMAFASRLEHRGLAVLVNAGLPRPRLEFAAPWDNSRRLDAAYPESKIGIEWDSKRWHTQVAAFETDRRRDRQALLHGWRVFRFTWEDVTDRKHEVIESIRSALSAS